MSHLLHLKILLELEKEDEKVATFHVYSPCSFQSEKLLGSLGGIFSKKWKPKKNREIKGPFLSRGKITVKENAR